MRTVALTISRFSSQILDHPLFVQRRISRSFFSQIAFLSFKLQLIRGARLRTVAELAFLGESAAEAERKIGDPAQAHCGLGPGK